MMSARRVQLSGGAPWGFRMHGGADHHQPLRIARVNPGSKASLCGIREGDVITSISDRPTKGMSNGEAHAMLRSAGPMLTLGLNEDREMSPRRRSIGSRSGDLKRPSQLLSDMSGRATPQAPVYATIKPPHDRRPSLSSLPGNLSSTQLVKSLEEPLRFHPTNPFYSTLPSNHSNETKLPVPNGRAPSLDRTMNKSKDTSLNDLKASSAFNRTRDSGPNSLRENANAYKVNDKNTYSYNSFNDSSLPNETKGSDFKTSFSDPFEKYLKRNDADKISYSQSDNNFIRKEEIKSTITEEKYSEIEELKTIKKIILNGSDDFRSDKRLEFNVTGNGTRSYPQADCINTSNNLSSNLKRQSFKSPSQENQKNHHLSFASAKNDYKSPTMCNTYQESFKKHDQFTPVEENLKFNQSDYSLSSPYDFNSPKENIYNYSASQESFKKYQNQENVIFSDYNHSETHNSFNPTSNECPKGELNISTNQERVKKQSDFSESMVRDSQENSSLYNYNSSNDVNSFAESPKADVVTSKPPVSSPTALGSSGTTNQTSSNTKPVWRPGAPTPPPAPGASPHSPSGALPQSPGAGGPPPPPPPPVWAPNSAGPSPVAGRKNFRPVHFEDSPPVTRKFGEQNGVGSASDTEGRLRTSLSAPATGLNHLSGSTGRLPRAQNPTVTLLQKAREGQLPRGASYLQQERDAARLPRDRVEAPTHSNVHALRREYASEGEAERSDPERGVRKMAQSPHKIDGIGPTTKDGMPVALRSEVKDTSRWYKKMYDTIHKSKFDGDQQQRQTTNKSHCAYFDPRSGYLSEPEGGHHRLAWSDAYDSDVTSGPRRRTASVQEERRVDEVTSPYLPSNKYSTLASAKVRHEVYRNQPGRIEDYVPGKSSVVDKEAKQWWDEVMDIFDGQLSSTTSLPQSSPREKKDITSAILSKSNMAKALKESGYESDSTLVFRRRDDNDAPAPLSPAERHAAYRTLQAGGEPPLRGFRSPAPNRTESPRRYVESDVNIHYKCPVRNEPLPLVPERELARQQAEHMKRLYREQKRNKYLQELQDMQSRRHQDNFTPSQKAVVPLNRYDEAEKVIAKALYTFTGQTNRELSFRKGDIIHLRRQIDANWYEGELHGRIGLFPYNYVEIQKGDKTPAPKKPQVIEGRARAKFDFTAQTNLELPLKKGEVVTLTRRIDHNWWEGRNGSKTGIFPDSYVTVLQEPSQSRPEPLPVHSTDRTNKPVASPAAHGLLNGSAKRSMGPHSYMPQINSPALSNAPPVTQPLPSYGSKTNSQGLSPSERGYGPPKSPGTDLNNREPLYVDTNAEAVPYRVMYKYRPQNPDELELNEGDTVYVLEKCDDGWYVGSSQRTGRFGTFPGNYVEKI